MVKEKGGDNQRNRDRTVNAHEICPADAHFSGLSQKKTDLTSLKGPRLTASKPRPPRGTLTQCLVVNNGIFKVS